MSIKLSASPLMALFYLTRRAMIITTKLPAHTHTHTPPRLLLMSLSVTYIKGEDGRLISRLDCDRERERERGRQKNTRQDRDKEKSLKTARKAEPNEFISNILKRALWSKFGLESYSYEMSS